MLLTINYTAFIMAVFYTLNAVTKKVRPLMYTESRGC